MKQNPVRSIFDPEFTERLCEMFERQICFNQVLGLQIESLAADAVSARLQMRPELIGHFTHQRLHGGVVVGAHQKGHVGLRSKKNGRSMRQARRGKLRRIDTPVRSDIASHDPAQGRGTPDRENARGARSASSS